MVVALRVDVVSPKITLALHGNFQARLPQINHNWLRNS